MKAIIYIGESKQYLNDLLQHAIMLEKILNMLRITFPKTNFRARTEVQSVLKELPPYTSTDANQLHSVQVPLYLEIS